jgi:hypothetical protein
VSHAGGRRFIDQVTAFESLHRKRGYQVGFDIIRYGGGECFTTRRYGLEAAGAHPALT